MLIVMYADDYVLYVAYICSNTYTHELILVFKMKAESHTQDFLLESYVRGMQLSSKEYPKWCGKLLYGEKFFTKQKYFQCPQD